MSGGLKTALRAAINRARYPRCRIGEGTIIRGGARLATGTTIARNCSVDGAQLCEGVSLDDGCIVEPHTKLGWTRFGPRCTLQTRSNVFNSTIEGRTTFQPGCEVDQVTVGAFSYVAREAVLNQTDVGRFCSIGPRSYLGAGEHPVDRISTSPAFYSTRNQCGESFATVDTFEERKRITIGHDVWIGAHVFVRDGVTIGNGAIIAAGAVVTKDIPPFAIAGGVPAKIIRFRFSENVIAALQSLAWWNWPLEKLRAAQPVLAKSDPQSVLEWAAAHGQT
jgi:chloramphenicol O-acetyltransferase type B